MTSTMTKKSKTASTVEAALRHANEMQEAAIELAMTLKPGQPLTREQLIVFTSAGYKSESEINAEVSKCHAAAELIRESRAQGLTASGREENRLALVGANQEYEAECPEIDRQIAELEARKESHKEKVRRAQAAFDAGERVVNIGQQLAPLHCIEAHERAAAAITFELRSELGPLETELDCIRQLLEIDPTTKDGMRQMQGHLEAVGLGHYISKTSHGWPRIDPHVWHGYVSRRAASRDEIESKAKTLQRELENALNDAKASLNYWLDRLG